MRQEYSGISCNLTNISMATTLDFLFPIPSRPPSDLSPPHWPGISPSSTDVLRQVLKHNHDHWHTFFNDRHFHNHAPHRSLALWAMGADGDVIRAGYEKDCGYEKPAIQPPEDINKDNFNEHLGDERYYRAYLAFFADSLQQKGIGHTLEEYLFSPSYNVGVNEGPLGEEKTPLMLERFFSGVLHSLIHTGYGLEFGLPGLVAEGLAQTAVVTPDAAPLVPPSLFDSAAYSTLSSMAESAGRALHDAFGNTVQSLDAAFDSVLPKRLHKTAETTAPQPDAAPVDVAQLQEKFKAKDMHVLDILGWVSQDMRFAPVERESFYECVSADGEAILKFSRLWKLDVGKLGSADKRYLDGKIEELAFLVTVIYGIGGWTGRGQQVINADFFLMHLVTSSLFLPSVCAYISPVSQARLLHTYLAVALGYYVFRGCPPLDIVGFQKAETELLQPAGPQPTPAEGTLPSPTSEKAVNPNPWLPIIQTSVVHPDEHVPKTQRALAQWAAAFGTRRFVGAGKASDGVFSAAAALTKGDGGAVGLELEGAEYLDGSVFVRTAELTAKRLGRVREGEEGEEWDFKGFFDKATILSKSHL